MRPPRNVKVAEKKLDSERMLKRGKAETKTAKQKAKAAKDPDAPKRPPSAFFVFMEEFRKSFKEQHPDNKAMSAVGKAGGEKWKSMSDAEKAPYAEKASGKKAAYEKDLEAYNNKKNKKKLDDGDEKSKSVDTENSSSEVNDDAEHEASSKDV